MADTKISALAELAAVPASGDLLVLVDVSDTSMAASGTDKKIQFSNIMPPVITGNAGSGAGSGTTLIFTAGQGGATGIGGGAYLIGGAGGGTSGNGGIAVLQGGNGTNGDGNGGDVYLIGGTKNGSGLNGVVRIRVSAGASIEAVLDAGLIASTSKVFTFPNTTGTLALTSNIPTKAADSDITTGTDDAKFLTSKALADAAVGKIGAAGADWSPSLGGWSGGDPSNCVYNYFQIGKFVVCFIRQGVAGTSTTGATTISLPVAARTETNMLWFGTGQYTDNNVLVFGSWLILSGGTVVTFYKDMSNTAFTTSGNKRINGVTLIYETA